MKINHKTQTWEDLFNEFIALDKTQQVHRQRLQSAEADMMNKLLLAHFTSQGRGL